MPCSLLSHGSLWRRFTLAQNRNEDEADDHGDQDCADDEPSTNGQTASALTKDLHRSCSFATQTLAMVRNGPRPG
jgi:hypothetical protein